MYKHHASPLARVVHGTPDSWERVVATATFDDTLFDAVWSPCNRFIAVTKAESVELLDAVTLGRLFVFDAPYTALDQQLGFSPDSRFLALCVDEEFISWDLQTGGPLGTTLSGIGRYSFEIPFSSTYSEDGKVVAAAYSAKNIYTINTSIRTYDLSGTEPGTHYAPKGRIIAPIWTHEKWI